MRIVVSYDIPDDRRRTKLANVLLDYGQRVQYSVFECQLTVGQYRAMQARIRKVVSTEEDSVRFYKLCDACAGKVEVIGTDVVRPDQDVYIV